MPPTPTSGKTVPGKDFKSNSLAAASNTPLIGRSTALAGLQQQANRQQAHDSGPTPTYPKLKAFLSSYLWPWFKNYIKNAFRGRFKPYPGYDQPALDRGVYPLRPALAGNPVRLAIAGDWATGTVEAYEIACAMQKPAPDYTIHLGDVYYVGDQPEVNENFLGEQNGIYTAVKWPRGTLGEFALIGNHEMYGGGKPYFTTMLPTLRTGTGTNQKASFFALETDHWRIIALDTGYNSVGLPILGAIPWMKKLPFVHADCRLEPKLIDWLRTVVRPHENRKPTILLSHHQYFSAFDPDISPVPATQLAEFFSGQPVLWIWAHEHRLGIYKPFAPTPQLTAYGRCLGNGGMPVDVGPPDLKRAPCAFYDPREDYPLDDDSKAGYNGFLELLLDGPTISLEYLDIHRTSLFRETFHGSPSGELTQSHDLPAASPLKAP